MSHRWRRVHLPLTSSTQEDVQAMAEAGAPAGTVVRADAQTHGRGRGDRAWASPQGGLWFSALLRPRRTTWGLLPILAGVSVASVLAVQGLDARVKWPNDVLVDDRKVCGVLLSGRTGEAPHAVLGVGLNANLDVGDLPDAVRGHATTTREELGRDLPVPELLDGVLEALALRLDRWERGEDEALVEEWERLAWGLGSAVILADGTRGTVEGLEEDGALRVRPREEGTVRVTDGDAVTWLAWDGR